MYGVCPIHDPWQHVNTSKTYEATNCYSCIRNSTKSFSCVRMANIDVSLHSKGKSQPIGGSVEDLGSCLQGELKQEACYSSPVHRGVAIKRESVNVPKKSNSLE